MCSAQAEVRFAPESEHRKRHQRRQKTPGRFSVSPEGFPATSTNKIRLGGLLPLPAPPKQTQRAEAGGEERKSGRQRSCVDLRLQSNYVEVLVSEAIDNKIQGI